LSGPVMELVHRTQNFLCHFALVHPECVGKTPRQRSLCGAFLSSRC
jgi:hypothetical protein